MIEDKNFRINFQIIKFAPLIAIQQLQLLTKNQCSKKFLILFLSFFLSINNNANAHMFNKFKKGFYFEKYSTTEEAEKALLKLYPIGSNANELVRTLDIAVGKENIFNPEQNKLSDRISKKGNYIYFEYRDFLYEWTSTVWLNEDNTIKDISVNRDIMLP